MKIITLQKMEELLQLQWTKFVDYKNLMDLIINNIPLYAGNWNTIVQARNISTKKVMVSKVNISQEGILFWFSFEIPMNEKTAVGTAELLCALNGTVKIQRISGNFFSNYT